MNGPEVFVPIAFFITIGVIVRSVLRYRVQRMELQAHLQGGPSESAHRLERMEQAIDAMAVEIERISEAQRFTTRLLSERATAERSASDSASQQLRR